MKKGLLAVVLCLLLWGSQLPARAEGTAITNVSELSAAVLMEPATVTRLWGEKADEKRSVAGLSKLPAILTLCEAMDEGLVSRDGSVAVSSRAAGIPGPSAFLSSGEVLPAWELMKAAVMISAGDAIMALGESAYGSESVFVENINVTLRQIGLSTEVRDPLGTGETFSAWDLAMLGKAAAESKTFTTYCCLYMDSITHMDGRATELVNANRLIKNYAGSRGLLTGSSAEDGYCGIYLATRNGTDLIAVVLGSQNANKRTVAAVSLLDYGFANFRTYQLAAAGDVLAEEIPVEGGDVKKVNLVARENVCIIAQTSLGKPREKTVLPDTLSAPLTPDTPVGTEEFRFEDGSLAASVPLYPENTVHPFGMKDIILRIIGIYCQ
jgi:D-alanyl-D-alanine carboxypeptidase (penicillin-binding protein 5/6)